MSEVGTAPGGDPAQTTVFVSYSRADRKRALQIIDALKAAGYMVWWDGALEGGVTYVPETAAALNAAKAVVVIWSPASVVSHWVLDEAGSGRDRKRLVPVAIDGAEPPLGFRQFQVIDLTRWRGRKDAAAWTDVLRAVAALHARTGPDRPVPAASVVDALSRRRLLVGAGAAAILAGGALLMRGRRDQLPGLAADGIAVLPFRNVSSDASRDYICEGLAAEIRSALARNKALRVVAQASSEIASSKALDAPQMSRTLGAVYLLTGGVQFAGETMRVTAELTNGRTGFNQWSDQFDRPMTDLLAVQSQIAAAVAAALDAQMTGRASEVGVTAVSAAFDAYLRGKKLYASSVDEASDLAALEQFDVALALDPDFAGAHAARAQALTVLGNAASDVARAQAYYRDAAAAADSAVRLGPDLAEAYSTLGNTLFQAQLRVREARAPFERSRELGRGEATVMGRFAIFCALTGRDAEAVEAMERALALDPLNANVRRALGTVHFAARRYEETIIELKAALKLNPELGVAHAPVGMALIALGRFDEAAAACALETSRLVRAPCEAIAFSKLGKTVQANQAYEALVAAYGDAGLYQQAQVLAQTGEPAQAMALLTKARTLGDSGLVYARTDPSLDSLRGQPEFIELLSRLGFD